MQIVVKAKNIEITPALRSYAERKIGKIERYFEGTDCLAQVMLRTERGFHVVEVTVQVTGLILRAEERTPDMYASIDGVVEKLERQIHKWKTRVNHKGRMSAAVMASPAPLSPVAEEPVGQVIRTKRFAMKPMSVEEAVTQLELIGHDFFVFRNSSTETVNVVYRRADGNYGLIEPEY